jgi:hypothetical protein
VSVAARNAVVSLVALAAGVGVVAWVLLTFARARR